MIHSHYDKQGDGNREGASITMSNDILIDDLKKSGKLADDKHNHRRKTNLCNTSSKNE